MHVYRLNTNNKKNTSVYLLDSLYTRKLSLCHVVETALKGNRTSTTKYHTIVR